MLVPQIKGMAAMLACPINFQDTRFILMQMISLALNNYWTKDLFTDQVSENQRYMQHIYEFLLRKEIILVTI